MAVFGEAETELFMFSYLSILFSPVLIRRKCVCVCARQRACACVRSRLCRSLLLGCSVQVLSYELSNGKNH